MDQQRILCGFGGEHPGIFSVRASDGGGPVRLTTNPFGAQDLATDVSPDGRWFVFFRFKPGPTNQAQQSALFMERLDGTGLRQITPYGVTHAHDVPGAQWSPDGQKIISATTGGGLFTVNPDGSGLRVIHLQTAKSSYRAFEPGWSPDGTEIIFGMSIGDTEGIFTANAEARTSSKSPTRPRRPTRLPIGGRTRWPDSRAARGFGASGRFQRAARSCREYQALRALADAMGCSAGVGMVVPASLGWAGNGRLQVQIPDSLDEVAQYGATTV